MHNSIVTKSGRIAPHFDDWDKCHIVAQSLAVWLHGWRHMVQSLSWLAKKWHWCRFQRLPSPDIYKGMTLWIQSQRQSEREMRHRKERRGHKELWCSLRGVCVSSYNSWIWRGGGGLPLVATVCILVSYYSLKPTEVFCFPGEHVWTFYYSWGAFRRWNDSSWVIQPTTVSPSPTSTDTRPWQSSSAWLNWAR